MSDTYTPAPAPVAPAAPAPASAPAPETPINQSPTTAPKPLGAQAPQAAVDLDKLKGSEHRPQSRAETTREAVRRAFERSKEPGPAQARMGHNNPPEEMKKEEVKREAKDDKPPINLKKPPSERPRGEHGHFASAEGTAASTNDAPRLEGAQAGQSQPRPPDLPAPQPIQLPEGANYRDAPKRFSDRARAEWGAAPESVRAEVHRMHHEFSQAYQQMREDHEAMNEIRHYHQLAKQHGTTLAKALDNYTGMESRLRQDPVGGLDTIVWNLNLQTADGQRLGLRDIAWHVLNQSPDQHQATQVKNMQVAIAHQMQELRQQQAAIAQATQQLQDAQRFAYLRQGVDQFAESHPRTDELADVIKQELDLGFTLDEAYKRAELLKPATQAAQTRTPTAQTRSTDRSIHGAPDRGPANGRGGKHQTSSASPRDAVARAMKLVNGSL